MRLPRIETNCDLGPRDLRQRVGDRGERAPVADADRALRMLLEVLVQVQRAGRARGCATRRRARRARVDVRRHDDAELQREPLLQRLLERDALGGAALDEDLDPALLVRAGDQAVDLDARDRRGARDLRPASARARSRARRRGWRGSTHGLPLRAPSLYICSQGINKIRPAQPEDRPRSTRRARSPIRPADTKRSQETGMLARP